MDAVFLNNLEYWRQVLGYLLEEPGENILYMRGMLYMFPVWRAVTFG